MKQNLLHVRRYGSGPPIVMIHGIAGSGIIWHKVIELLKDDYELIVVDLLGYGKSPKPFTRYSVDTHISAIHGTLAAQGVKQFQLMGLSMGSLLAAAYARKYPEQVERITLVGLPYFRTKAEAKEAVKNNFWCRLTLSLPVLAGLFIGSAWALGRRLPAVRNALAPEIYSPQIVKEALLVRYRGFASSLKRCMINYRIKADLDRISQPIEIIQGDNDSWTPIGRVEQLVADYDNIHLKTVKDAEHNIAVLAPESIIKVTSRKTI